MAQSTEMMRSVQLSLDALEAGLESLIEVAAEWEQEPLPSRIDWEMEWRDLMGRMDLLDRAYRSGQLSPEQTKRYRTIARGVAAVLPTIERLGLASPPASFRDAAGEAA